MNYIYNIFTNFNEDYYDFFEWEKNDNILHIKKMPIIKIDKIDYCKLLSYNFRIDIDLIKTIKNKTELFNKDIKQNYQNLLLITNGIDIIGIEFDNLGNCIKRSSITVEEELDINQITKKIKKENIKYILKDKIDKRLKTRKETKTKQFIIDELYKLSLNNNKNKIIYLYYECFNNEEKNVKKALNTIFNNINREYILKTLNKTSIK